ncbi:MAG: hypothetical protein LBF34_03990 [Puniceicoccales bacterium]|nr:hypothetical protein [Puniceicoccales bacterium]
MEFFVLIPQHNYKLQPSDNESAQSLVLGIEYNGVKMLFPGDAPGKMFSALPRGDQQFVQNVNILVAPHHGSFEAENERWYCYTRKRTNNQLFCVIASCDPDCGNWKLPKKRFRTEGESRMSGLCQNKHGIRYYNDWINKCCTYETRQSKFVTCMASVGYHVKVGNGQEKALKDRIKIFEVLRNEAGDLIEKPVEMKDERKSIVCNIGRFVCNVGRFVCKCFSNAEGEEEETSLSESESDSSTRSAETGTQPQLPPGGRSSAGSSESSARSAEAGTQSQLLSRRRSSARSSESSARSAETGTQSQLLSGVGLANLGVSCYINASVQLLYAIPSIRTTVLQMAAGNNRQLQGLQGIFRLMQNPPSNRTIERNLLEKPCEQLGYIAGRQEDITEFITGLLDAMEKAKSGSTACVYHGTQTIISYKHENERRGENKTDENSVFYTLGIKNANNTLLQKLEEEYNTITIPNKYEYNTEGCYARNAQKTQKIAHISDYMLFQIMRFRLSRKLADSFEFPFELNLQAFCTKNIQGSTQMELCGVVVHSGATSDSGHYFIFLKDEHNRWWKYNDGNITAVAFTPCNARINKEVAETFFKSKGELASNQTPYILLYKKTQ